MKIVKRMLLALTLLFGILTIIYLLGPKPNKPNLMSKIKAMVQSDLRKLEAQIIDNERNTKGVRPDNEARIVWADSSKKQKTPYAFVYLPGFSASQFEGAPLHTNLAKRYGANLYLPRLFAHGIETENNLLDFTPEKYFASALEAIEVGKQLGDKVVLISTSTGGTLSLIAAAQDADIQGLIMFSPNIAIASSAATLLDKPWGLEIARMVHNGSNFHEFDKSNIDDYTRQYWTWRYRIESLVALESLVSNGMIEENFRAVKCPVFVGCYYQNEENQDPVVSVAAMDGMFSKLGTATEQKRMIKFPDAKTHVIACKLRSKSYEQIEAETFKFVDEVVMGR